MKRISNHKYSHLKSFDDFKSEREKLAFRNKLNEVKIELSYSRLKSMFSVSNSLFSLLKEAVLPRFSGLLDFLLKKTKVKTDSDTDNKGEYQI